MKQAKYAYRVRNWSEYDAALVNRGSLTFWVDEAVIASWRESHKSGQRGASRLYSDAAMEAMAGLKGLFGLPGRAYEGFLKSVFSLMGVALPVPDHSTLSRRLGQLTLALSVPLPQQPRHLVLDSSGFKVYGEGEWKVRVHGRARRRRWLKLHLGLDANPGKVVRQVTPATHSDSGVDERLIQKAPGKLAQVSADGAYDAQKVYQAVVLRRAKATIRPNLRRAASASASDRARNVARVQEVGLRDWKLESGYSRRALAETDFSRLKRRFGDQLGSRKQKNQHVELQLLTILLNRFTHRGMPKTERVAM